MTQERNYGKNYQVSGLHRQLFEELDAWRRPLDLKFGKVVENHKLCMGGIAAFDVMRAGLEIDAEDAFYKRKKEWQEVPLEIDNGGQADPAETQDDLTDVTLDHYQALEQIWQRAEPIASEVTLNGYETLRYFMAEKLGLEAPADPADEPGEGEDTDSGAGSATELTPTPVVVKPEPPRQKPLYAKPKRDIEQEKRDQVVKARRQLFERLGNREFGLTAADLYRALHKFAIHYEAAFRAADIPPVTLEMMERLEEVKDLYEPWRGIPLEKKAVENTKSAEKLLKLLRDDNKIHRFVSDLPTITEDMPEYGVIQWLRQFDDPQKSHLSYRIKTAFKP
jgi:hypothetical protein